MATSTATTECPPPPGGFRFGPWPIGADEVFYRTELSFAFVNLKPLVPGKVFGFDAPAARRRRRRLSSSSSRCRAFQKKPSAAPFKPPPNAKTRPNTHHRQQATSS